MVEREVDFQELAVKAGVFPLWVRQLLGEEHQRSPGTVHELLQNCTQVGVRSIQGERNGSIGMRMHQLRNRREKRDLPGPLRVSVSGSKPRAAPGRNFLYKLIILRNILRYGLSDSRGKAEERWRRRQSAWPGENIRRWRGGGGGT